MSVSESHTTYTHVASTDQFVLGDLDKLMQGRYTDAAFCWIWRLRKVNRLDWFTIDGMLQHACNYLVCGIAEIFHQPLAKTFGPSLSGLISNTFWTIINS